MGLGSSVLGMARLLMMGWLIGQVLKGAGLQDLSVGRVGHGDRDAGLRHLGVSAADGGSPYRCAGCSTVSVPGSLRNLCV